MNFLSLRSNINSHINPVNCFFTSFLPLFFSLSISCGYPIQLSLLLTSSVLFDLVEAQLFTMRWNAALTSAVLSSAALIGNAQAQEAPAASEPEVERPTFTVRQILLMHLNCSSIPSPLLTRVPAADKHQSSIPRAIHRRLGVAMDTLQRQKGGLEHGGGLGLCRNLGC